MAENESGGGLFGRFKRRSPTPPDRQPTLADQLEKAGMRTASPRPRTGQSFLEKWGFVRPKHTLPSLEEQLKAAGRETAEDRPTSQESALAVRNEVQGRTAGIQLETEKTFGELDFPGSAALLEQHIRALKKNDHLTASQIAKIANNERKKYHDRFKK